MSTLMTADILTDIRTTVEEFIDHERADYIEQNRMGEDTTTHPYAALSRLAALVAENAAPLTFNVGDSITGRFVRTALGALEAEAVCRGLNLPDGTGSRYTVWVVESGTPRRLDPDEYISDTGQLTRRD
ncbi:hypothetical protein ACWC1D_25705 [Streptomyces sp. NPDC001478]